MNLLTESTHRVGGSVGVIGAGIFGVSASLELSGLGIGVTLYERRADILEGATARSFFRLHRGYHYPRDPETAQQARDGYLSFSSVFADAFVSPVAHHYAIAATESRTKVEEFRRHCDDLGLYARPVRPSHLVPRSVQACFEVEESYYDAERLRKIAWEHLRRSRVRVELGHTRSAHTIARVHDFLVVAAYGSLNEVLLQLGHPPVELQYELCEVPIVHAPDLQKCSLVVLDGPFVSVGPYGKKSHLLYDVVNSVHRRAVGRAAPDLSAFAREIEGPPMSTSAMTRFDPILSSAQRFLSPLHDAVHLGSLFAERVVMPRVSATDARPTVVQWVAPEVLSVLSGKVSTSVDAGRTVARAIATRLGMETP